MECIKRSFLFVILLVFATPVMSVPDMQPLSDQELAGVHGQAMFVSDYREGTASDGIENNEFGFYRLMLNAKLETNLNIDKLQLGCGGVNDGLAPGCDVDIDYLSLMGANPAFGPNPNQVTGAGRAGDPVESLFELQRPYVEFAMINPDDPALREVAGIKVGSESANGFMSIGRFDPDCGNPNNVSCHMGINQFSGYMDANLEGVVDFDVEVCLIFCFTLLNIDLEFDHQQAVRGTRMTDPVFAIPVTGSLLGINLNIASLFRADLRYIHGVELDNTDDFFLSFQREPITFPAFDEGDWAASPSNTGWWMNLPGVQVRNLEVEYSDSLVGTVSSLFGVTTLEDRDVGQRPANNCWGAARFC